MTPQTSNVPAARKAYFRMCGLFGGDVSGTLSQLARHNVIELPKPTSFADWKRLRI
jgi:hypothetical protein